MLVFFVSKRYDDQNHLLNFQVPKSMTTDTVARNLLVGHPQDLDNIILGQYLIILTICAPLVYKFQSLGVGRADPPLQLASFRSGRGSPFSYTSAKVFVTRVIKDQLWMRFRLTYLEQTIVRIYFVISIVFCYLHCLS